MKRFIKIFSFALVLSLFFIMPIQQLLMVLKLV